MKTIIKTFSELTTEELFEIYKLRVSVFVVEQKCPYQEVDDADKVSYHVWLQDHKGIEAYARVIPAGVLFPETAIGRVIAVRRRCGLGTQVVQAAIQTAREKLHADTITLEAQVYAHALYEKLGFQQTSDVFLEDGIPHIQMQLKCSSSREMNPV
jgi:ElaA protein